MGLNPRVLTRLATRGEEGFRARWLFVDCRRIPREGETGVSLGADGMRPRCGSSPAVVMHTVISAG